MARVRHILVDWFHHAISHRRDRRYFSDTPERFEGRPVASEWILPRRRPATQEAQARGMRLLSENLTPAQRDQYERHGYFDVAGGETGRRYRIKN